MVSSAGILSIDLKTGGILSLLDESDESLLVFALQQLNSVVDIFWAEIADSIDKIEILYEKDSFSERQLAALVASKVYYHLGEYGEALTFALGAGKRFNINIKNDYVETIVSKCIDQYISKRQEGVEKIDSRLEDIVQNMFNKCYADGESEQAIGIALESYRLDVVEESILKGDPTKLLAYVSELNMMSVQNLEFRNKVLRLLVKLYQTLKEPDYISISQCLVHLDDFTTCSNMLQDLIKKDENHVLIAYQIAFDIEESAKQEYLQKLLQSLPVVEVDSSEMDTEKSEDPMKKIRHILSGELSIKLYLEFLYRNNKADLLILKNTKNALDSRNSVFHSGVTFANAFMNAGTTSDEFLRQNLDWLSRASNWTKFSATAALGVIHKGHISQGRTLLSPYLPQPGVSSSSYSEGGSLFALGLINANHGSGVLGYLRDSLKNTQIEVVQHGACLGVGVAGMATDSPEIYEELKSVLFSDSAVAGEAAGLAMGLVMLGTASKTAIEEMLQYAHETQHEKIIRGLSIGMSLIMYGQEENADAMIEQLCSDKDPILRYGGIYTVAMAYAGTGNNKAIRRLLHVAVSDVNDDVRRAAVTALGFLLFKTPNQVPRLVQLLSESYNPHVRYGATLALGISCAGTGLVEALDLLEPLSKDPVDYVRQGAFIALAMILIQTNETSSSKVGPTRKLYETVIKDKHEDVMARLGAVLGQGIIDAGGRNVTISLQSASGHSNMSAIVGMAVFTQFWYWYPLAHFLSLSLTPTAFIGLDSHLEIPKFSIVSNAKPSLFAYPPATKPPTSEVIEKVATAVLSTTNKAKARAKKAEKEKQDAMDTDEPSKDPATPVLEDQAKDGKAEEKKKKREETSEVLGNMTRVLPTQLPYLILNEDCRYQPVKKGGGSFGGIVCLIDKSPSEPRDLIVPSIPATVASTGGTTDGAVPNTSPVAQQPTAAPSEGEGAVAE